MSATVRVKHRGRGIAVRESANHSHTQGVLRVKLSCGSEIEKDAYGYSLTLMQNARYHTAFGIRLRIRSFCVDSSSSDDKIQKATLSLRGEGLNYMQAISIADFHALFHAFNPELIADELNLLSTSEEEVIATDTDQVPAAGTNNA